MLDEGILQVKSNTLDKRVPLPVELEIVKEYLKNYILKDFLLFTIDILDCEWVLSTGEICVLDE